MPQSVRQAGRGRHGADPVRLCVHQRGHGDGTGAGGRRATAAGVLWRHFDADHDRGAGLCAQRPRQPQGGHQARRKWPAVVTWCGARQTGQANRGNAKGSTLGCASPRQAAL